MGSRSTGRKLAMQTLYQADIQKTDIESIINNFVKPAKYIESTKSWALELVRSVWEYLSELDALIEKFAIGWDLNRINAIDRNILRIAFYELNHTETDVSVVLNEAIEIAKKYSCEESPKFINGILGKYVEKECLLESSKS
ncbi:transcription antitermination factor NusB [Candidatus Margulisiibacteriota bacterium]